MGDTIYFDYTTASFLFNLGLNLSVFVGLFIVFLVYRLCRGDKQTLGNLTFYQQLTAQKVQTHELEILRKQNITSLDQLIKTNWLKILFKLDEEDLQEIQGTDLVIYIKFVKYSSIIFFILMVIDISILIPVYVSGEPEEVQQMSGFSKLTIIMASSNITRVWVCFAFVFINSIVALGGVFAYWFTSLRLKARRLKSSLSLSEKDIAQHCILIRNLNQQSDPQEASNEILALLDKHHKDKILSVRVVGQYKKLFELSQEWDHCRKYMEYYQRLNATNEAKGHKRKFIIKNSWLRMFCCLCAAGQSWLIDAETHYKNEMERIKQELIKEENKENKRNAGCCIVMFKEIYWAKKAIKHSKDFLKPISQDQELCTKYKISQWGIHKAPPESDIIWDKFGIKHFYSKIKSFLLYISLFLVCVVFITPLTIFDTVKPLADILEEDVFSKSILKNYLPEYLSPLILILFNSLIIPILIDLTALLEDHETLSRRQVSIFFLDFFFMCINTIFIPLTNFITIREFLDFVVSAISANTIFESLSKDMGNMGSFFIRYMMQMTFVINMVYLLDIPHFLVKTFRKCTRKFKHEPFVDNWFYDLGYFQAYNLMLFTLVFMFQCMVPLISVFGFLFFFLRYYFEKYQMTFVYLKEFEAKGKLKRYVLPLQVTSIMVSQLLNYAFLKAVTKMDYILGLGIGLVVLQVAAILGFLIYLRFNKKKLFNKYRGKAPSQDEFRDVSFIYKLKTSFRHPWLKIRNIIFNYYDQKREYSPVQFGRISDLNLREERDFATVVHFDQNQIEEQRKSEHFQIELQNVKIESFKEDVARSSNLHSQRRAGVTIYNIEGDDAQPTFSLKLPDDAANDEQSHSNKKSDDKHDKDSSEGIELTEKFVEQETCEVKNNQQI